MVSDYRLAYAAANLSLAVSVLAKMFTYILLGLLVAAVGVAGGYFSSTPLPTGLLRDVVEAADGGWPPTLRFGDATRRPPRRVQIRGWRERDEAIVPKLLKIYTMSI
jgi:hypothetical protein